MRVLNDLTRPPVFAGVTAAFAALSVTCALLLGLGAPTGSGPRLAQAGATLGLAGIVVVALLLIAGVVFLLLGRRRRKGR